MDNAGDWLYIVFLVIAGISSLFSSQKKKKRPTQVLGQPDIEINTRQEKAPDKGFWDVLQEMQHEEPKPKKKKKVSTHKQPQAKSASIPTPFLSSENEMQKPMSERSSLPTMPEEEESLLPELEFNNTTELRKAVIYTEILNRKY